MWRGPTTRGLGHWRGRSRASACLCRGPCLDLRYERKVVIVVVADESATQRQSSERQQCEMPLTNPLPQGLAIQRSRGPHEADTRRRSARQRRCAVKSSSSHVPDGSIDGGLRPGTGLWNLALPSQDLHIWPAPLDAAVRSLPSKIPLAVLLGVSLFSAFRPPPRSLSSVVRRPSQMMT